MKLESCGWSQMKAYFKSFNFWGFFLDYGKGVKLFFKEHDFYECVISSSLAVDRGVLKLALAVFTLAVSAYYSGYLKFRQKKNQGFPRWP